MKNKIPVGLWVQIAAILGIFLIYLGWLSIASLTDTERTTLNLGSIWELTVEHLSLTFLSALIVLVIAIPLGIALTRPALRFLELPVTLIVNIGQAAPAIGVIVLLAFWLGFSFQAALVAVTIYALLPVLRNTMLGLNGVDSRLIEAARGMGMSATRTLFQVELPLAVPVMLSGIRTALVLLVGTVPLAAFIDGGGLGLLITTGVNLNLVSVLASGALLVALLALAIDWVGRVVEYIATPKGLSV